MRCWLATGSLLLATLGLPAGASSPVERWPDGAWWELQLEHMTLHHRAPRLGWTPSFRLRFQVTRGEKEVRVEVTTVPENRFRERLVLRYSLTGELLSAQVTDPERVVDLSPAGGFGVFGMLGRQAFVLTQAPKLPPTSERLVRVAIDDAGSAQIWGAKDPWWLQYETLEGLPQRATLVSASWRTPPAGEGRVTPRPDDLPIGPAPEGSSGGSAGSSGSVPAPPREDTMVPVGPDRLDQLPTSTGTPPGPGSETGPASGGAGSGSSGSSSSSPTPKPVKKKGWATKKKK